MSRLPVRGPAAAELGLRLPPARMAVRRGRRPLKRWLYVGVYTPELMLCAGHARIGPVPRRWWAVALPGGELYGRSGPRRGGVSVERSHVSIRGRGVEADLELGDGGERVEIVSEAEGGGYIWTAKRAAVDVRGRVSIDGVAHRLQGAVGFVDDSAGYHDRHTRWRWSAGVGRARSGERLAWNLVDGIHDGTPSERTLWVDGAARELGPVAFEDDLTGVRFAGGEALAFEEWSAREEDVNMLVLRSRYRQPFGTFSGELPGGLRLDQGAGVMEEHDVLW